MPDAEIIIAADAPRDDCRPLAEKWGAVVVEIAEQSGPAVARNRAAARAAGDILVFVDNDVVVAPDAIPGMCRLLRSEAELAGVFGAYDDRPAETNFMSQYKNLSHAYVHRNGRSDAATFWAGLGAIRARAFRDVGGFDERFRRPSVEDIELGYRVTRLGYRLRLDPRFRGCHLKRWTLWGSIVTDIRARGIPWTQVLSKFRTLADDLNTRIELRLSVLSAYVFVAALLLLPLTRWAGIGALIALAGLAILNIRYYRWFVAERGLGFALRVFPAHLVHHLCNGISFLVGTVLFVGSRLGVEMPGAIPRVVWSPAVASRTFRDVART
jgi:glycosyltransferase involved in cell wall biosynthesis